ncbi:MAG: DUF4388 domain-containing protein [Deltaproteobacteria bacterium]|nr:DUF4388 domain-containing protein [Deltaproteobacteria bacterium]
MEQNRKREPLSFADILKFLASNRKTGILKVASAEGELLLHFSDGKIVGVDMPKGQEWVIGQYLTEGEVISDRRLVKALRIAASKRQAPEDVLVRKGYVSPDVLKRFMDLYSREVILPLFSKVGLVCSFLADPPVENRWLPPVSVAFLLKEGDRRAREWPLLTKRVPSSAVVYAKDKSFIAQVMKEGEETGNPLFSDRLDPELGANERIVYYFTDGRKTVKQVSRASGLDLFSTYRAFYTLENKFMVKVVSSQGAEAPRDSGLLQAAVRVAFYGLIFLALLWLGAVRPGALKLLTGERKMEVSGVRDSFHRAERSMARSDLEAATLQYLACPGDQGGDLYKMQVDGFEPEKLQFTCTKKGAVRFGPRLE